jgi:hypothetical protein
MSEERTNGDNLDCLVGSEVAIRSERHPQGMIVRLQKDRWGVYFDEPPFHKAYVSDEDDLEVFELTPNAEAQFSAERR